MEHLRNCENDTRLYEVGIYIEDKFTRFALCTSAEKAQQAENILLENGYDSICTHKLCAVDTLYMNDKKISL